MSDPEIRIEENGPYEVKGPLPIARTRTVKTEFGEPVDYAPFEPLEADETYRLCRCGKSGNKPFCDDSHLEEPRWTSRRSAITVLVTTGLTSSKGRTERSSATISRSARRRATAKTASPACGRCWGSGRPRTHGPDGPALSIGTARVGRLGRRARSRARVRARDRCLQERAVVRARGRQGGGADGEPYEVRNRQALCRCGYSQNKPFCDGSHKLVGFRDAG